MLQLVGNQVFHILNNLENMLCDIVTLNGLDGGLA